MGGGVSRQSTQGKKSDAGIESASGKKYVSQPQTSVTSEVSLVEDREGVPNALKKDLKRMSISANVVSPKFFKNDDQARLFQEFLKQSKTNRIESFVEELLVKTDKSEQEDFLRHSMMELKKLLQINTLARELALREDSKSQYAFMIRAICDMVDADRAVLYLCDHSHGLLRVQIVRQAGLSATDDKFSMTIPIDDGVSGIAVQTGRSINIPDAYQDDRVSHALDESTGYKTKSLLTVPVGVLHKGRSHSIDSQPRFSANFLSMLQHGTSILTKVNESGEDTRGSHSLAGEQFGRGDKRRSSMISFGESGPRTMEVEAVIQVMNKINGEAFSEDDVKMLESVATIISGFISHAKLQEKERIERVRKETILDIAVSLGSTRDIHSLIHIVVSKLQRTFNVDRCSLFFVNKEKGVLWTLISDYAQEFHHLSNDTNESVVELPLNKGIAGYVAKTGEMVNLKDAYMDSRFNQEVDKRTHYRTRSILCGPIKDTKGEVIAVVQLINKKSDVLMNLRSSRNLGKAGGMSLNKEKDHAYRLGLQSSFNDSFRESIAYGGGDNLEATFDEDDEALLAGMFSMLGVAITNMELFSQSFIIQNRLKCVLENVSELVLTVDQSGKLMGCNRTSREINAIFRAAVPSKRMRTERLVDWVPDETIAKDLETVLEQAKSSSIDDLPSLAGINRSDHQLGQDGNIVNYTIKPLVGAGTTFDNLIRMQQRDRPTQAAKTEYVVLDGTNPTSRAQSASVRNTRGVSMNSEDFRLNRAETFSEFPFEGKKGLESASSQTFRIRNSSVLTTKSTGLAHQETAPATEECGEFLGAVICIDDKTPEQKLMKTLNKYLAPDIVEHLLTQGGKLQLGGVKQKVSILFSDIRGFTTFSEEAGAQEVFQTLNEYFSCMVDVVTRYGGIVDKFIGDALMAVFGVPKQTENDAKNACLAAVAMEVELEVFNKKRIENGKCPIKIGVGVSTGEVFCGNIGSENRFEYTVIGDSVNVASRLESSTKEYGIMNLVSDATFQDIVTTGQVEVKVLNEMTPEEIASISEKEQMFFREVDLVRVAGKDGVTKLYEVIGLGHGASELLSEEKVRAMSNFAQGLNAYRRRDVETAFEFFEKAADDGDVPSILFEERCDHLLENGGWQAPDWDGVWDMQKVSVWTYKPHKRPPPMRRASSRNIFAIPGGDGQRSPTAMRRQESKTSWFDTPPSKEEVSSPVSPGSESATSPGGGVTQKRVIKNRDRKRSIIIKPNESFGSSKPHVATDKSDKSEDIRERKPVEEKEQEDDIIEIDSSFNQGE